MATFLFHTSCILVSLSLLFLFFMNPSSARVSVKVTKDTVNELCSHTADPDLCVKILSSDPRTDPADLQGLLNISISLGLANATDTSNYIKSLLPSITDPDQKQRVTLCSNNYVSVIAGLNSAADSSKKGNYEEVRMTISDTINILAQCVEKLNSPPPFESPLTQRNLIVDVLINLIIGIVFQLEH